MKRILVYSLLLISCAVQPGNAQAPEPEFRVTADDPSNQIDLKNQDNSTVIDITSPSGIGSATFELESGSMPETITLQLHLSGLEEIRLSSDRSTIAASIASTGSFEVENQRLIRSGAESALTPADPLWMDIRVVSGESTPTLPLQQGFFELELPQAFLRETGDSFVIHWVDFYR
jgi:hypothetical protein